MTNTKKQELSVILFGKNIQNAVSSTLNSVEEALSKCQNVEYELIIVDDGSDVPLSISKEIDREIRLIRHENSLGIGDALLSGCRIAKFENIMFLPGHNFFSNVAIENVAKLTGYAPVILGYRQGMDHRPVIKRVGAYFFRNILRMRISHFLVDPHGLPVYPRDKVLEVLPTGSKHALHIFLLSRFNRENVVIIQTPAPINSKYSESLKAGSGAYLKYFSNICHVAKVLLFRKY